MGWLKGDFWLLAKISTAYIGAVIGAGFASGQEIMQFLFYTAAKRAGRCSPGHISSLIWAGW